MDDTDRRAERFDEQRPHLRAVAYRLLGSLSEADDAVQETWLRLSRSDSDAIENLGGWLTTVVGRVSLNMLRARKARREESLDTRLPDPVVGPLDGTDPEYEALIADSVGLALLVVLETLPPAERLAFVLHDMFAVPFADIASITERSPEAARQLASRARRHVRGHAPVADPDVDRQRTVVDAFFAASRDGDFEALLAVLDPDIVLRADGGTRRAAESIVIRGGRAVAERAMLFSRLAPHVRPALINGAVGAVVAPGGRPFSVMAFTVSGGRIVEIDAIVDPERLAALGLGRLG